MAHARAVGAGPASATGGGRCRGGSAGFHPAWLGWGVARIVCPIRPPSGAAAVISRRGCCHACLLPLLGLAEAAGAGHTAAWCAGNPAGHAAQRRPEPRCPGGRHAAAAFRLGGRLPLGHRRLRGSRLPRAASAAAAANSRRAPSWRLAGAQACRRGGLCSSPACGATHSRPGRGFGCLLQLGNGAAGVCQLNQVCFQLGNLLIQG